MADAKPDQDKVQAEHPLLFASLITAVAGFLDAVGYASLGHLYVSFMSGNSTSLGLAIAKDDMEFVFRAVGVIASFVFGAFLGTLLDAAANRHKTSVVLAAEVLLVAVALLLIGEGDPFAGMLPVCVAMGMQNACHRNIAGADVGKGFVTGSLYGIGQALAKVIRGQTGGAQATVYAVTWACFVAGVVTGGLALAGLGLREALLIGGAALVALTVGALIHERRGLSARSNLEKA
jgi:uncharacterized membrane protein YoaK (UPF0700 family)